MMFKFASVRDLADRYSVSTETVWRWSRIGKFPAALKLPSGSTRWDMAEVLEWEKENKLSADAA